MKLLGSMMAFCLISLVVISGGVACAQDYATMSVTQGHIVWHPLVSNGGASLSVTGPNDVYINRVYKAGDSPSINISDNAGGRFPDGQYSYQLCFTPVTGTITRQETRPDASAPITDPKMQSGSFRVVNGEFLVPSAAGEGTGTKPQAVSGVVAPSDIIEPDDLIVQGSLCVGLDCVNGESFGFDTIRLKENNTRIKFEDTSTSAGFPANDWQITANDSNSGGASYLAFDDVTGVKTPFKVLAGAPTNSLYVGSNGKVGLKTAAPVLDLSFYTSDTPAIRLEQNNSGGFTAQTWDIGANEANFFVRDVTGGSRLPLRVRPGAPTSSIDINASGNVGIGTASPGYKMHVVGISPILTIESTGNGGAGLVLNDSNSTGPITGSVTGTWQIINRNSDGRLGFKRDSGSDSLVVTSAGNVGIGTITPTHPLQVCGVGGCSYNDGGLTWVNASSREYKDNIQSLPADSAINALKSLNPVTFTYKALPEQSHVGFIAEDVPDLVAMRDRKSLSPLDIVAVLTKVVQEQSRTIEEHQKAYKDQQITIDELKRDLASLRSMVNRIVTRNMVSSVYPE